MTTSLCKYKHVFGKEKEGFHKQRLFGLALYDVLGTIIGAWLISTAFQLDFWIVLVCSFILAIILHRLFCVNTTINKMIFGKV